MSTIGTVPEDHEIRFEKYLDSAARNVPRIYQQKRNSENKLTKVASLHIVLRVFKLNAAQRDEFQRKLTVFTLYSSGNVPGFFMDSDNVWAPGCPWRWEEDPSTGSWLLHTYFARDNGALDVSSNHRNIPFVLVATWDHYTAFSAPFKVESKEPEGSEALLRRQRQADSRLKIIADACRSKPPADYAVLCQCAQFCREELLNDLRERGHAGMLEGPPGMRLARDISKPQLRPAVSTPLERVYPGGGGSITSTSASPVHRTANRGGGGDGGDMDCWNERSTAMTSHQQGTYPFIVLGEDMLSGIPGEPLSPLEPDGVQTSSAGGDGRGPPALFHEQ